MARARNIKPGFFKNEILGTQDPILMLLFAGLWCLADKAGRLEDRPIRIKAELFPYREKLDLNSYLTDLERLGFIHRYAVNGMALIQIVNFHKHQHPHHTEKESELPEFVEGSSVTVKAPKDNGYAPSDSLNTDSLIPSIAPSDSANRSTHKVTWSESGFQIPDSVRTGFKTAYPAVAVEAEIAKAHAWALANPKNRKSNWGKFLNSWLARAQDKAPRVPADNPFKGVEGYSA